MQIISTAAHADTANYLAALAFAERRAMPANNLMLLFRRT